jgi:hypothetical protein
MDAALSQFVVWVDDPVISQAGYEEIEHLPLPHLKRERIRPELGPNARPGEMCAAIPRMIQLNAFGCGPSVSIVKGQCHLSDRRLRPSENAGDRFRVGEVRCLHEDAAIAQHDVAYLMEALGRSDEQYRLRRFIDTQARLRREEILV